MTDTSFLVRPEVIRTIPLASAYAKLAIAMIADGRFFSQGWRVGCRIHKEEGVLTHTLFAVAPGVRLG